MESLDGRRNIYLKSEWDGPYGIQKYMSKPTFHKLVMFSPDLFAIELKKPIVKIDKPIYVGATILDISKTKMYEFHYGFVKKISRQMSLNVIRILTHISTNSEE